MTRDPQGPTWALSGGVERGTNERPGIWSEDFVFMGIGIDEDLIKNTPKDTYRKYIKSLIRKAAFKELIKKKNELSKIRAINYTSYEIQPYLKCNTFNKEQWNNVAFVNHIFAFYLGIIKFATKVIMFL